MVSSIIPNNIPTNIPGAGSALGGEPRFPRTPSGAQREDGPFGDRVELSGASLAAVRESVRAAVGQVHLALAVGHDAQAMLVQVQTIAREGGANAQADLDAVLNAFIRRLDAAVSQGARLVAGEDIIVQAEPGGAPVSISGADLSLEGDIIGVSQDARADDRGLGQTVQRSLEALHEAMSKLLDSARGLEAHQGFLGAVEGALAGKVRGDLDTESARLLALQVRQGLEGLGAEPIVNAGPHAVLALFRA